MRIANLTLKDFRIYEQASVTFDEPLCIFRGHNHQGKSSLAQAIQLALTRRTDGTDPRGAGANDKIRVGGHKAVIDLEIVTKKGPVALHVTYGPNKQGRQGGAQDPGFEKFLDANSERLNCVLDAEYFISLKPEAQKAVLASLVLPAHFDFDSEIQELTEKYLGRFAWDKSPVALIDQVYEAAYSARREAKAALSGIHIPVEPAKPQHTLDEINTQLKKLRQQAAQEQKALASDVSVEIARVEQDIAHLERDLEYARSEYVQVKDRVASEQKQVLSGPEVTRLKKLAAGRLLFDQLTQKIKDARDEQLAQQGAQEAFEELRAEPRCPTCTQAVTKDFLDNQIRDHRQWEERAIEEERKLLQEQKDMGDIAGAERALADHAQATNLVLAAKKAFTAADEKVRNYEQQITDARRVIAEAKEKQGAPQDTSKLDEITAKIEGWEALLSPVANYNATIEQIEKAAKLAESVKAKVDALEKLCSYFGKDGIKAELIQQHICNFEGAVNQVLRTWGYETALSIEPYEFLVTNSNGKQLPLKEISKSEQLMFGVALQCAIASASKIRLVVIDRADTFINSERGKLFKCVRSMIAQDMLDQVIILVSDDKAEAPSIAGVAFYRVSDGQIERLGQPIEAAA